MTVDVTVNGRDYRVQLERDTDSGAWKCRMGEELLTVDARETASGVLSLLIAGESHEFIVLPGGKEISWRGRRYETELRDPRALSSRRARAGGADGPKKIVAPMPGKVVRIIAPEGTEVAAGAGVIVIEAMKMQNELKSPKQGRVARILASEGTAVNAGDVLAVVE
jgi:biotin carboxyl carrier protein